MLRSCFYYFLFSSNRVLNSSDLEPIINVTLFPLYLASLNSVLIFSLSAKLGSLSSSVTLEPCFVMERMFAFPPNAVAIVFALSSTFLFASSFDLRIFFLFMELRMMKKMRDQFATSMLLITHDLGVVAEICDRVAIMYAGEIVEYGRLAHIF